MDFDFKSYQIKRFKNYFKKVGCFLIFQSSRSNFLKWLRTEQEIRKLKANYYKPLNKATVSTLKDSIYSNFSSVFSSFILLFSFTFKSTSYNFQHVLRELKPSFTLVGLKINDKIYPPTQLKGFKDFSYRKNMFNLYRLLDKNLKLSYTLTNQKKSISK